MSRHLPLLHAMRADSIPEGEHGFWQVKRIKQPPGITLGTPGIATGLYCLTSDTYFNCHGPDGTLVMIDHLVELRTHLNFVLKAHGNVLVTGLGLGCVIRGLLANGRCEHITVVERSASVIALVWPHMPHDNITLVYADAREWCRQNTERFDYGWHDLWSDSDRKEPPLQLMHAEMIGDLRETVRYQGAWNLPRWFERRMPSCMAYGRRR